MSMANACSNMADGPRAGTSIPIASVIVPVFNAKDYLEECLHSILNQIDVPINTIELVLYDDASTDGSFEIAVKMRLRLERELHSVRLLAGKEGPLGVGSARNRACQHASAPIFVFLDADDIMLPNRISRSVTALRLGQSQKHCIDDVRYEENSDEETADIVGGRFQRIPEGSTPRYEDYHHRLTSKEIFSHAFRDAPLAMPTIACRSEVWHAVPFEEGRGIAEDLHFFYGAMKHRFRLRKLLGDSITLYRFHETMTSLTLHRRTLLAVRVNAFEELVLVKPEWRQGFSIWNSGRDGKDVFKLLSDDGKTLVRAWGDIDERKIGRSLRERPIVHFSQLKAPIACCVTLDREGREFEGNLASLKLRPGIDYVHLV